jgi:hypothetical protein
MEQIQKRGDFIIVIKENIKTKFKAIYRNNLEDIIFIMVAGIVALILCVLINNWVDYSHLF